MDFFLLTFDASITFASSMSLSESPPRRFAEAAAGAAAAGLNAGITDGTFSLFFLPIAMIDL